MTLLFNVKKYPKIPKMTIHNQYHPAALQKFVALPKIPKITND